MIELKELGRDRPIDNNRPDMLRIACEPDETTDVSNLARVEAGLINVVSKVDSEVVVLVQNGDSDRELNGLVTRNRSYRVCGDNEDQQSEVPRVIECQEDKDSQVGVSQGDVVVEIVPVNIEGLTMGSLSQDGVFEDQCSSLMVDRVKAVTRCDPMCLISQEAERIPNREVGRGSVEVYGSSNCSVLDRSCGRHEDAEVHLSVRQIQVIDDCVEDREISKVKVLEGHHNLDMCTQANEGMTMDSLSQDCGPGESESQCFAIVDHIESVAKISEKIQVSLEEFQGVTSSKGNKEVKIQDDGAMVFQQGQADSQDQEFKDQDSVIVYMDPSKSKIDASANEHKLCGAAMRSYGHSTTKEMDDSLIPKYTKSDGEGSTKIGERKRQNQHTTVKVIHIEDDTVPKSIKSQGVGSMMIRRGKPKVKYKSELRHRQLAKFAI